MVKKENYILTLLHKLDINICKKNILHRHTASRKKSRIMRAINILEAKGDKSNKKEEEVAEK